MTKLLQNEAEVDLNITYVFIVNQDLNMSTGKIASQVAHVAIQLGCYNSDPIFDKNGNYNGSKVTIGKNIVLFDHEETMLQTLNNYKQEWGIKYIIDAGLTEGTKNKLTCIGFVRDKNNVKYTKGLKAV